MTLRNAMQMAPRKQIVPVAEVAQNSTEFLQLGRWFNTRI